MYRLIVLDMDGTLLNSNSEISKENKTMLKKAKDAGVNIAIATGRIFTSARFYAEILGINTPIIACNGALIRNFHDNRVIYSDPLKVEDAIKVIEICDNYDLYYHFYDQEKLCVIDKNIDYLKDYYWRGRKRINDGIHIESIGNSIEYIYNYRPELLKFVIVNEDRDRLEDIRKEFNSIHNVEVDKSWYNNLEIMNKGVSKGKAILKLSQLMNIKKDEIIAFGDNYNDLSMKDYVGTFVAMGNSEAEVKNKAHYVTETNDNHGVAIGIKKYLLS
ncbi:HAD family phosphatase [Alkaliphilus pronyensis]|uniref:HAD family phosphatase n=1 Tax=Alkaliphilus pronyensis TaxID=1482732 RepID=A0A6I0F6K3_9FIRM|nr:Cof-type HAD-IIB family hydrolase [Alkaliphilus pronyensis]KAB3532903.1 HAD family phosphatase [Alkaliphilus pronyensis]